MLIPSSSSKYFFYLGNTDMRKGFDSLSGIVTELMQSDPMSSDVYIFLNRRHTQMKLLQWECDGFAVYYKRLENGTYELPSATGDVFFLNITSAQLQMIFNGISIRGNRCRKRNQHRAQSCG